MKGFERDCDDKNKESAKAELSQIRFENLMGVGIGIVISCKL
jgi:hypothetical protein